MMERFCLTGKKLMLLVVMVRAVVVVVIVMVLPQQLWLPMCPFVQLPAASRAHGLPRETTPQAGEKRKSRTCFFELLISAHYQFRHYMVYHML